MRLLSIVGARPQFIKEAVVQREIRKRTEIEEILVHTGQHYDQNMSGIFFADLGMSEPDINLNVGSGGHGEMTGRMMIELERVMLDRRPDVVLVYGDTNSTLAGALVATKLKIPVAHVEAGLRQDPKDMPEEINRVLTDHSSKYLFCPSRIGVENLRREGIEGNVFFVGDVMYDLFQILRHKFDRNILSELGLEEGRYVVATLHRDFNVDRAEILEPALAGLRRIAEEMPVVFPIHPRTKKRLDEFGFRSLVTSLKLMEPLGYLEMMGLLDRCHSVVTDSGGLQKEAYFADKRSVVLMEDSSWRELVDCGWNTLTDPEDIADNVLNPKPATYPAGIYGNGDASARIIETIDGLFGA